MSGDRPRRPPSPAARTGDAVDWLLEVDPSIRWQTERGLADAPEPRWRSTQERVGSGGWGRRRSDGRWAKESQYGGETFFALEPGRVAGRWDTLRVSRVLRWWDGTWETATTNQAPTGYGRF